MKTAATLLLAVQVCLAAQPALAGPDEQPTEQSAYSGALTGDWRGARRSLEDAGVSTEFVYKFDIMGNASGGIEKGVRGLDNFDAIFTFDGEKIAGVKGLSAKIYLLNNFGGHPDEDLVGSAQDVNNIEVSRATGKLYTAYIEQNLLDDRLSFLLGLYDYNSEFYVTESSALFLHNTFGVGTDASQSGQNGPSIFPFISAGGRIRVTPAEATYIQVAILDGVPGDVDRLRGTHIDFDEGDGWLVAGETGYAPNGAKIAVGGWYYTEKLDHQALAGVRKRSRGAYIIGEKQLSEDLTAFARFGVASGGVNQFDYAWSAGIVYTGLELLPAYDAGQLGFGVTRAHNSSAYKQAAATPANDAETSFELTYSDKITPWLSVQPDIQYVVNPGTDKALDDALVLGVRIILDL